MKILEDVGFCTCCGNYGKYKFGDEEYSLVTKNLANYNKYKDLYVYQCSNCGFVSTDITGVEGVLHGNVINSLEYKNALNYNDFDGLDKELYNNHSAEVPANLYEAYSYVCLEMGDYEKYIRTINKTIELKEVMARKYRRSQDELGGEEENDDLYNKLDELINNSIQTHRKQIDFYFTQLEHKSLFVDLIYLENMAKMGKKEEAFKLFNKVSKRVTLKEDLKNYMLELLK